MKCICEACKTERAARTEKRRAKWSAQYKIVQRETYEALRARLAAVEGIERNETMKRVEWTCGDGRRILVMAMDDSHLHFALAKGYRCEYPDSRSRQAGVEALQAEALYRLAKRNRGL